MHPAHERIRTALAQPGKERDPMTRYFEEADPALVVAACDAVPADRRTPMIGDLRRGSAAVLPTDGSAGLRVLVLREALYHLLDQAAGVQAPAPQVEDAPTSAYPH